MSKDDKKRPDDDVKSRRELLAATAKLSAFIGAMGLTGTGLAGSANAQDGIIAPEERTRSPRMHKVRPRTSRELLPAVQKRQLKRVLQESLRTGNPRAALKRHPDLRLSRRQQTALMRISKQEWAALRSAQSKMAAFGDKMAGDTGYVFW